MVVTTRFGLTLLVSISIMSVASRVVRADDGAPAPAQSQPPPIDPAYATGYVAPLSQTVQPTYVPQSVALSGPFEITDTESRPLPEGYTAIQRPRTHMLYGGIAVLASAYGLAALTAAIGQDASEGSSNPVAALWVPIAGPFIELGQSSSATADVLLVGLGAAQIAGAIAVYYGLTSTQTVYVRNDLIGSLSVGAMATKSGSGLVVSGRF